MSKSRFSLAMLAMTIAMTGVVVLSNFLVQHQLPGALGPLVLGDLLTFGAFTFPLAFLVTDLANRMLGVAKARQVVLVGFSVAVLASVVLATPRIALASGASFLLAQLLDVQLFARLSSGSRQLAWWQPPAISSFIGSVLDSALFFTLAFAAFLTPFLGWGDGFATQASPLLGVLAWEAPRWVSWALGDLAIKLLAIPLLLVPYRAILLATGLDGARARAG